VCGSESRRPKLKVLFSSPSIAETAEKRHIINPGALFRVGKC
jgi:hypothetical protein